MFTGDIFNMNPKLKAGCYNSLQRIQPGKGVLWCFMMMNGNWEADVSMVLRGFELLNIGEVFDNSWNFRRIYPLVNLQKAIENGHL